MAKRQNEFFKLKDLLQDVYKENKLTKGMQQLLVEEKWGSIMGKGVVSYTQSVTLNGKTLYVKLNSSVLREELSYGKEKIIKMLNEELGEKLISKIVLN
ncbi:MAG: DUF721 domain-containing protein [Lutibacter sp.]|jgi:hypothetical protein|uniref:DUF721 domain-containing protein n=1 Tax=Lutibacter sp. TaxID=1925666 RepID=UPI00299DA117|nr:DUF721 domain-containing protein [Lutibacter sp.]MDX1830199.1 DUF721 domain-containing protein [Lutibacter sp.]